VRPTQTCCETLIDRHRRWTGSRRARQILDDWPAMVGKFVKVMPIDYRARWSAAGRRAGGNRCHPRHRGGVPWLIQPAFWS
jgi:glutamate synthase domain-containing protein 3